MHSCLTRTTVTTNYVTECHKQISTAPIEYEPQEGPRAQPTQKDTPCPASTPYSCENEIDYCEIIIGMEST